MTAQVVPLHSYENRNTAHPRKNPDLGIDNKEQKIPELCICYRLLYSYIERSTILDKVKKC
jgi:hypothetical protein